MISRTDEVQNRGGTGQGLLFLLMGSFHVRFRLKIYEDNRFEDFINDDLIYLQLRPCLKK